MKTKVDVLTVTIGTPVLGAVISGWTGFRVGLAAVLVAAMIGAIARLCEKGFNAIH